MWLVGRILSIILALCSFSLVHAMNKRQCIRQPLLFTRGEGIAVYEEFSTVDRLISYQDTHTEIDYVSIKRLFNEFAQAAVGFNRTLLMRHPGLLDGLNYIQRQVPLHDQIEHQIAIAQAYIVENSHIGRVKNQSTDSSQHTYFSFSDELLPYPNQRRSLSHDDFSDIEGSCFEEKKEAMRSPIYIIRLNNPEQSVLSQLRIFRQQETLGNDWKFNGNMIFNGSLVCNDEKNLASWCVFMKLFAANPGRVGFFCPQGKSDLGTSLRYSRIFLKQFPEEKAESKAKERAIVLGIVNTFSEIIPSFVVSENGIYQCEFIDNDNGCCLYHSTTPEACCCIMFLGMAGFVAGMVCLMIFTIHPSCEWYDDDALACNTTTIE